MRDAMWRATWLAVGLSGLVATASRADQRLPTVGIEPFALRLTTGDVIVVDVDRALIDGAVRTDSSITVRGFPLTETVRVDLVLRRFSVTGPRTRLVIGSKGASDRVTTFDPSQITLLRGYVPGVAGSHVYMALRAGSSTGYVDLGSGRPRYLISSKDAAGALLANGRMSVFLARSGGSPTANAPLCGVGSGVPGSIGALVDSLDSRRGGGVPTATGGAEFRRGVKHMELAVETDFEFFQLIGDVDEAFAYLVEMYGAVSDIYMRDVDTRIELVFARIWDNPDDLFNDVDPSPLGDFRDYWNENMGHVHRDLAQLFSGRRDYPFGGQATLSTLCTNAGYSVVGYAMGFFPDPTKPDPYHYDVFVTAHEIGHNAGTGHTQNYGIDTCQDPNTIPQRGSIMSYCQQTWSGLNANQDFYFHSIIQDNIDAHIAESACIVADCNMNSIDDADDIQEGVSDDVNDNGIPDECEDCNENDILDDEDIRSGNSRDLNDNGIPDECEPDCNNNNIPDDKDIADGTSEDRYGDDIPDECETDCNHNGVSDYTELQLDMPLDVNRDTLLDACQDCDDDGTMDLLALQGSHFVWIASGLRDSTIREFYGTTGVLTRESSGGTGSTMNAGQDVVIAPDGRVLVSSAGDDRVASFDAGGAYLGDLVPTGRGGLDHPTGLAFTRDGRLLVASRNTNNVLAYDRADGTFLGQFVNAGDGGLTAPFGLTIGPDGDLYVTSGTNEVIRYDGSDGSFVEVFVIVSDNGGLDQPRGLTFKPDGNLLVASFGSNETIEYDGETGASLGKWAQAGTETRLNQVSPWGIRIGPNGNVFIVRTGDDFGSGDGGGGLDQSHDDADTGGDLHLTDALTYEYNARTGWFMRSHIGGNDHGMEFPTGFAFAPDRGSDCNVNQLPDNCDIATGRSEDVNENGVPDECEIDCNDNGTFDQFDIIPLGASRDCNANRVPDECDLASGTSEDLNENGTPDECDPDCNYNRVPDDLDIERGESDDCNEDGVPDECQIFGNDCDGNGVLDDCDPDCDDDGVPDACDFEVLFGDDFEADLGWTAINLGATSGDWERGVPVNDPDWQYDPLSDSDGSGQCFVTDNGPGNTDVDDGAVRLVSPRLDMAFGDVVIRYDYYLRMTEPGPDRMLVEINSDDGQGGWIEIALHDTNGGLFWRPHEITQAELEDLGVVMTDRMRVRFTVNDANPQSIVESGLDAFQVAGVGGDCNQNGVPDYCDIDNGTSDDENGNRIPDECELGACCTEEGCENTMRDECFGSGACLRDPEWVCDGDVDGDGQVNPVDAGLVQAAFGSNREDHLCSYDMDCDGQINPVDSGIVQSLFGTCDAPRDPCPNPSRWFVGEDCESFECP